MKFLYALLLTLSIVGVSSAAFSSSFSPLQNQDTPPCEKENLVILDYIVGDIEAGAYQITSLDTVSNCLENNIVILENVDCNAFSVEIKQGEGNCSDASFIAIPMNGTPPFQYNWDRQQFIDDSIFIVQPSITAGPIPLVVRDANGCEATNFYLPFPGGLVKLFFDYTINTDSISFNDSIIGEVNNIQWTSNIPNFDPANTNPLPPAGEYQVCLLTTNICGFKFQTCETVIIPEKEVICPEGDVTLLSDAEILAFVNTYPNCTKLIGNLNISSVAVTSLTLLQNLQTVEGQLFITGTALQQIDGLSALQSVEGIHLLFNSELISVENFDSLTQLQGDLMILSNHKLSKVDAFNNLQPQHPNTVIRFFDNPELTAINGFQKLQIIKELDINIHPSLIDISGFDHFQSLGSKINITGNIQLATCNLPSICQHLIEGKEASIFNNASGCNNLEEVNNACILVLPCPTADITFVSDSDIQAFKNNFPTCTTINGNLNIAGPVTSLKGLEQLEIVTGEVYIVGTLISNLEGLENLKAIESLFLTANSELESIDQLNNLETIFNELQVGSNPNLQYINGFKALAAADVKISFIDNDNLIAIYGFEQLKSTREFFIDGNEKLESIDGFAQLESLGSIIQVSFNARLSLCQIPSICNHLNAGKEAIIAENDLDCRSVEEVVSICNENLECPDRFIRLTSDIDIAAFIEAYPNCTELEGLDLKSEQITSLAPLSNITTIRDRLDITEIAATSLRGLHNITSVKAISILASTKLQSLSDLGDIENLLSISIVGNHGLEQLNILNNIDSLSGSFSIVNNRNLTTIDGFKSLSYAGNTIVINDNLNLKNITGFDTLNDIQGKLWLFNNFNLSICNIPFICQHLTTEREHFIQNNAEGCNTAEEILQNCQPLEIVLPDFLSNFPWLADLTTLKNCSNTTISLYQSGAYQYLYIEDNKGQILYNSNGDRYCQSGTGLNCLDFYAETLVEKWECNPQPVIDEDQDGTPGNEDPDDNDPCVPNAINATCPTVGETPQIFQDFEWLQEDVGINPFNCNGETITVYQSGSFFYLYVETDHSLTMYNGEGQFYCIGSPTYNCPELYQLTIVVGIWSCDTSISDQDQDGTLSDADPDDTDPCVPNKTVTSCITGGNLPPLFEEYDWLETVLDPFNCQGGTIQVYRSSGYVYLFVSTSNFERVYNANGVLYCTNSQGYDCLAFYTVDETIGDWACGDNMVDTDRDGIPSHTDPNDNDPCIPSEEAAACTSGGELPPIFEEYDWLEQLVDPYDCTTERITVYVQDIYKYIYVETPSSSILYTATGAIQCMSGLNYDCIDLYGYTEMASVWECETVVGKSIAPFNQIEHNANIYADFKVYPSPTKGQLTIETPISSTAQKLRIITMQGIIVYESDRYMDGFTPISVNLAKHAKGIYFIQWIAGDIIQTKRVVVE